MSVCCECCVLSGKGPCEGPIPRPEESYRVCVSLSVIKCNSNFLQSKSFIYQLMHNRVASKEY